MPTPGPNDDLKNLYDIITRLKVYMDVDYVQVFVEGDDLCLVFATPGRDTLVARISEDAMHGPVDAIASLAEKYREDFIKGEDDVNKV